ncbi:MAG: translation initiation factor IF-2 [Candidatus Berkelbacteria bacterium]|nr:translation initiation factor IF-2 [Candidatus Berkelbacteria bacterium]
MDIVDKKQVEIPEIVTVKAFSDKAGLPVTAVIGELMKNGVLASINETIDYETASIIGEYLGVEVIPEISMKRSYSDTVLPLTDTTKNMIPRPPVVTIMGHVDHGKTTLLDRIRKAHVADSESGGITQHISAYQVTLSDTKNKELKNKTITFIDTPGHAAFSSMREHGTAITDIVVLIVAANDGIMPQTIEVIKQAKSNNVPIIVAINKIDLPDADPMKVKQQLSEYELIPEEWGGKTVMVEISAKQDTGVDNLLEMILLQADMMELKANPDEKAVGVVIESHMQKGAGAMATVLIENGTLRQTEPIAIGSAYGKVRILEDFRGRAIPSAGPSTPVRIAGLRSLPDFGDRLLAFPTEREARDTAQQVEKAKPTVKIATAKRITEKDGEEKREYKELNLVIKCDVAGSLEALKQSIQEIRGDDYSVKIISEGVGSISESDITLAKATKAIVIGFRVLVLGAAKRIADKENVQIENFQVIYQIIDYIKAQIALILPPDVIEDELANGKVLAIFRDDRKGFVAGGMIGEGKITKGDEIKFFQAKAEKYRTKILSLRREKSEVTEASSGAECGFGLPAGANVAVGDSFVVFKTTLKKREIS